MGIRWIYLREFRIPVAIVYHILIVRFDAGNRRAAMAGNEKLP